MSKVASSNVSNPGPVEIDGYDQLEPIGRGGFSYVYRAHQVGFDRRVALKVLTFGLNDDSERRSFERECRAMGLVSQHPNIVTVFNSAFTKTKLPCLVMELYSGGTMSDRLDRTGLVPVETVLSTGVKIAGALHTAHERGLMHRDIKPQNIFVSEYGEPALGDFGISTIDDERTISGAGGLTVHYAPPEMLEGAPSDERSDIYSLAATLYTLLEGRRPFALADGRKQAVGELARRIILEEPAPIRRTGVPAAMYNALMGAMAKDPSARPATAEAFARQLQDAERELGLTATVIPVAGSKQDPSRAAMATASPGAPSPDFAPPGSPPRPHPPGDAVDPNEPAILAAPAPDDATADPQTITVSRREPPKLDDDTPAPSTKRLIIGAAGAAVTMAIVGVLVWFIGRDSSADDEPTSPSLPTSGIDDSVLYTTLDPPENLQLHRDEGEQGGQIVVATWSASDDATKYVVTISDRSGRDDRTREVDDTELRMENTRPRFQPCVEVWALNDQGKRSSESSRECMTG